MAKFKRIGLTGKFHSPDISDTWRIIIDFLSSVGVDIVVEERVARFLKCDHCKTAHYSEIGKHCDLLVVVGGDGSLLDAARAIIPFDTPVVGINRGKLGFLTDIKPSEIAEKLGAILKGEYLKERRFLLEAHSKKASCTALNEIILSAGNTEHMIEFEIYVNETFMCSQQSNGVIIATPTGSTAYNLSANGPILHPDLHAIVMVPMFAHTLTNRPIVLDAESHIRIALSKHTHVRVFLSGDCQSQTLITPGEAVHIQKLPKTLQLVHPKDYNYFEALRCKLYWGQKLAQQSSHS